MRITNLFGKISRAAGLTSVAPASRRRFFRRAMERKNRRPLIYRDKKDAGATFIARVEQYTSCPMGHILHHTWPSQTLHYQR